MANPFIGCAGWSIPTGQASYFPAAGSHLARYSQTFSAVEINTSFYRSHRPSTYARWASETPPAFSFAIKLPKTITHVSRLDGTEELLDAFLAETAPLGAKRGPLLVQLPPSLAFSPGRVEPFFAAFRQRYEGLIACEPRHRSWFCPEAERILVSFSVARVAADPAVVPAASTPGGWPGLVYRRLHGSPRMYYSAYDQRFLDQLAASLASDERSDPTWCIFDNTALGAATTDALAVRSSLSVSSA